MKIKRFLVISFAILTFTILFIANSWALTFSEAKSKGLISERGDGYVTHKTKKARQLANTINAKRRQAYRRIAKTRGTRVSDVATIAGKRLR